MNEIEKIQWIKDLLTLWKSGEMSSVDLAFAVERVMSHGTD
jgi:hypothetical protein